MTDPVRWAEAFNLIPDGWKYLSAIMFFAGCFVLCVKWWPRRRNGG